MVNHGNTQSDKSLRNDSYIRIPFGYGYQEEDVL